MDISVVIKTIKANQIVTLSKAEKPFSINCFVRETDFTGLIILMLSTVLSTAY